MLEAWFWCHFRRDVLQPLPQELAKMGFPQLIVAWGSMYFVMCAMDRLAAAGIRRMMEACLGSRHIHLIVTALAMPGPMSCAGLRERFC